MYGDWAANLAVAVATAAAVVLAIAIHYEGLVALSRRLARAAERPLRRKVVYVIGGAVLLHVAEIWVFGLVLWGLVQWPAAGAVSGHAPLNLFDAVYLSAMCYTTVGFGDLVPVGPIRLLAGTEALLGLVLIGWSASFTYLEMERYWRVR